MTWSFTAASEELMTSSCMLYSDLSTWDVREMSFANVEGENFGYYYQKDVLGRELFFNPCRMLNFDGAYEVPADDSADLGQINGMRRLTSFKDDIDHGTFGVFCPVGEADCQALSEAEAWLSDSSDAFFATDDAGVVINPDSPSGIDVVYETTTVCGVDEVLSLKYTVVCDETMDEPIEPAEGETKAFLRATVTGSDMSECQKTIAFTHYTGCVQYSALGFVNFLNSNVWLSGTLLIIFGLTIGLFGQKWFLPISGTFAGLCAFVAFMILASIFQWLNTTVGLIICGIFAIAAAVLAYWLLSRSKIAVPFLCIGGGFMLGSIIEGLIIAISGWESMVFYLIVTAACMVVGGLVGCQRPDLVTKYLTACVGSYIFMRGWTYYLGGFPSEMEMYNMMANPDSVELDFTGLFWFYVALFAGGIFAFVYIQGNWDYAKGEDFEKQN